MHRPKDRLTVLINIKQVCQSCLTDLIKCQKKTEVNDIYIKPALPVGEIKIQHKDIMVYTHSVLWGFWCPSGKFFVHPTCLAVFNLFLHWFMFHQLCSSYGCTVQPLFMKIHCCGREGVSHWGFEQPQIVVAWCCPVEELTTHCMCLQ
jgi:hypothetical protein